MMKMLRIPSNRNSLCLLLVTAAATARRNEERDVFLRGCDLGLEVLPSFTLVHHSRYYHISVCAESATLPGNSTYLEIPQTISNELHAHV